MVFEFTARSVLQLGAELISSDAVAIAELIKNAIDAGSPTGVHVDFRVVIRHADYEYAMALLDATEDGGDEGRDPVERARQILINRILPTAPTDLSSKFVSMLSQKASREAFAEVAANAYRVCNQIIV